MTMQNPPRFHSLWLATGVAALLILPWYGLDERFSPPALFAEAPWLRPLALPLLLGLWASFGRTRPRTLIAAGAAGQVWLAAEGLLIIHRGWALASLTALLGSGPLQPAMGLGRRPLRARLPYAAGLWPCAAGCVQGRRVPCHAAASPADDAVGQPREMCRWCSSPTRYFRT
jgi:hypothetical protein